MNWDDLHENPRFRPSYPVDSVVRFLITNRAKLNQNGHSRFLDIGTGAGRHLKLAADLGFSAFGIDTSQVGLRHAQARLKEASVRPSLALGSMFSLPFKSGSIQVALSYGVFYYGTASEMKKAIQETRRVLQAGGMAFIVLRTTGDCRFGKGEEIEPNTYKLTITETNEQGTVQHFLSADDITEYFSDFSKVSFEKSETTFANRRFLNSDWLVTAEK